MTKFKLFVIYQLGHPILSCLDIFLTLFSKVGNPSVFSRSTFDWATAMEGQWKDIHEEALKILTLHHSLPNLQDVQKTNYRLTKDSKWKSFFLFGYGRKALQNCKMCPKTTAILESIPGMQTAFFSVLSPKKHLPRHKGLYKGLIRCHLGLVIPRNSEKCWIEVEEERYSWRPGELFIFDNTAYHEVWNQTDEVRIVLLFDVLRPFPFPISVLNRWMLKFISLLLASSTFKKHQQWEKQFHSLNDMAIRRR